MVCVTQVVMFIKASRETHSGELVLIVRPNGEIQLVLSQQQATQSFNHPFIYKHRLQQQ
jgi:hypothetical protein